MDIDEGRPTFEVAARLCRRHPLALRWSALCLPGFAIGASVGLADCGVRSWELIGTWLTPGWALGGPLCAGLIVVFDRPDGSIRGRVAEWILIVGVSLVWAFPIGFLTYICFLIIRGTGTV